MQNQKARDLNEFMNDIEEDPELRQSMMLYKDQPVIDELEAAMAKMSLNKQQNKSPIGEALEKGTAMVGNTERKINSVKRQTAEGEQFKMEKEEKR